MAIIDIKESDSQRDLVNKINANFKELLKHSFTKGELLNLIQQVIDESKED